MNIVVRQLSHWAGSRQRMNIPEPHLLILRLVGTREHHDGFWTQAAGSTAYEAGEQVSPNFRNLHGGQATLGDLSSWPSKSEHNDSPELERQKKDFKPK